ncbi:gamma-glutamyl phosphate reductase [Marivirga tractuosa]|uniref:Gamma-glutamyl phosphate reductase n=1 Tax=Marivirga tractuosa (strain ATCC 23168 / DSM 4126 / NBRC 15989 / NCIMB 1408 / VKM B-1430 / H-43) TaxID=643867 RepID=E4TNC5_MARTH|nr:glutamate-5-semialdehyde dehydrogenase [Marivirga tractuosa]ADR23513.1 gamma-glutamyl phosphate reductase [Marivirga tractuosa DSM 4126]BDD15808.1 gamma-glutamyl phosphate reductase [Marivirga tractuosa]
MKLLNTEIKNAVLQSMIDNLDKNRDAIIAANKRDLDAFDRDDQALYDRLVVDSAKVDDMIRAVKEVKDQDDPVGTVISEDKLENGLHITNKAAPFGTIMIIYESRPDVTIEAAVLAFKANNKILLKGGKEAHHSNEELVKCWHQSLQDNGLAESWIQYLKMDRPTTQEFLRNPDQPLDLIVPRGGEKLIGFVKEHAKCAVLVSGRGNNFAYIAPDADMEKVIPVLINAKTDKISGCNALDKILVDENHPKFEETLRAIEKALTDKGVQIVASGKVIGQLETNEKIDNEDVWYEEFLAMKAAMTSVNGLDDAIDFINKYSGGHSNIILTETQADAEKFMEQIDSAAVYHNASTRFTDGGQMGVGAELAISTDKLHHRGPLGLKQLVTNKYYVLGNGQVRK